MSAAGERVIVSAVPTQHDEILDHESSASI
jgi:hypothetical protein